MNLILSFPRKSVKNLQQIPGEKFSLGCGRHILLIQSQWRNSAGSEAVEDKTSSSEFALQPKDSKAFYVAFPDQASFPRTPSQSRARYTSPFEGETHVGKCGGISRRRGSYSGMDES